MYQTSPQGFRPTYARTIRLLNVEPYQMRHAHPYYSMTVTIDGQPITGVKASFSDVALPPLSGLDAATIRDVTRFITTTLRREVSE